MWNNNNGSEVWKNEKNNLLYDINFTHFLSGCGGMRQP